MKKRKLATAIVATIATVSIVGAGIMTTEAHSPHSSHRTQVTTQAVQQVTTQQGNGYYYTGSAGCDHNGQCVYSGSCDENGTCMYGGTCSGSTCINGGNCNGLDHLGSSYYYGYHSSHR